VRRDVRTAFNPFRIFDMDMQKLIHEQVTTNPVVIYMKGTPQFPQCGFSARAVQALRQAGVKDLFAVNVLGRDDIRDAIKEYANWPTLPQIYIKGEFIGGCDIVCEMFADGELQKMLEGVVDKAA
jgi:monothiol glutaredoxin